uniref:Putative disease resistance protein RGA2 n=1 Tax=Davidia involucrata TaxID=16924 RepID=A0A5B7AYL3_DAVIN
MAEAFLQVVVENLNSLIHKEIGLLWGVNKEMTKLSSTLSTIQAVLEDAEQKQLQDRAIQNWLRKLKLAAYEVDDILDDCATEAIGMESKAQISGFLNKVHTLACYPLDNILFRHRIGNRMKEIREKLDEIAEERMKFHLREVVIMEKKVEITQWRQTGSVLTQPQVYGREEDTENIVEQLVERVSDCENVSVYPIVGMGGLGKTTIAQMVFNDDRVTRHFELRIWVCVSEDFDVKRLIKAIIESASGKACEDLDLDPLQRGLQVILNGKRYLLVLDDVWNEDQEKWDMLKYVLACGSRGASIITTTRLEKVALIMGTLPIHRLSSLSEDDCWSLFKQRAFGNETEDHPNLVAIGKEIVKKCGGVPLAAKALGSLMRFKREENEWLSIKESEIWNLPQDDNSILPALRLSYYNLSLELRRCFAYCAVFLKDSIIKKDYLIHLWMANGFISSKGKLEQEDIGNEIWNELYLRSFFQEVENDRFDDNVQRFKMHDLVHDLAQSVMEDDCHGMEVERLGNISNLNIHHFTLVLGAETIVIPKALYKVESLRTLIFKRVPREFSCDFIKFGLLRVLDASTVGITKLSSTIGNLKHLRYLNLSHSGIQILPESICSLWNLQTLNLDQCYKLQRFPKHMKYLRSLRHLYLRNCHELNHTPSEIGRLTCLKTLSLFVVGKQRGCHLTELKGLNLGGELRIKHLDRVRNVMDAKEANLVGKQNLRHLDLDWEWNSECELQEQLLEALEPPPSIEQLAIRGYKGSQFPLWMMNSILKNIVVIRLSGFMNCLQLPPLGQLPLLRNLSIYGMKYVEFIHNDSCGGGVVRGFPSLEVLGICGLPNLEGLSREEGRELFPHLRQLTIYSCPKFPFPCLSSLETLNVLGHNIHVVLSSIPNLNSLSSLSIENNDEVISFPEEMLRNLTVLLSLRIKWYSKLKVLPTSLANLIALKSLYIGGCHELESLPEQGLRGLESLQKLEISHCNKLKSLSEGLQHLTALESLDVSGCPELLVLPDGIRHLNSLQRLSISGHPTSWRLTDVILSPKMVALPLQHVPALQSLSITEYPDITSLPDWLGNLTSLQSLYIFECPKLVSLPDSIQSLTKLQTLRIKQCPELARRCEKGRGEDYYKIAHIPKVHFLNF